MKFFVKWTFLALLAGAVCGTVGAVFHHAVELAGAMFSSCGWLLYLLPVSGLAVVLVYRLFGAEPEEGANLVILSLRTGKPVPPSAAVRVFVPMLDTGAQEQIYSALDRSIVAGIFVNMNPLGSMFTA